MAAKRTATSELNHENWDDYEAEDAGTFKRAPENVIQNRVIRTAKRRNPISQSADTPKTNVFSNFSGFGKAQPFGMLSNNISTPKVNNFMTPNISDTSKSNENTTPTLGYTNNTKMEMNKSTDYYAKLKGLNESVSEWIKSHVDKNPFCILTPIFNDYEKHLKEIDSKPADVTVSEAPKPLVFDSSPKNVFASMDKPKFDTDKPLMFSAGTTSPFATSKLEENKSPLSIPTSNPITFGARTIFPTTFPSNDKPTENEEEDEPPKVEFTPVVEDGSIFSKKCKVFVKKDGNFCDRGVGQLFLKPVPDSEKVQLIVRANTSLGNLLLNLILSDSIPLQRMGKNNVMLVCIPTPDAKPPPVAVLLRVKTSEEADELLKVLQEHQK